MCKGFSRHTVRPVACFVIGLVSRVKIWEGTAYQETINSTEQAGVLLILASQCWGVRVWGMYLGVWSSELSKVEEDRGEAIST